MFYSSTDGQYIQEGTPFTIDGVQYPANWLNLSTPEEKTNLGLEEVVATNSPANDQYYYVSTELNGAALTYVNTPMNLTSVKTNAISQVLANAYSLLQPNDWMVVKAFETSTAINADWNTWRASVRSTADATRTAITSAADVDAVAAIMGAISWAKSPAQVASEAEQTTTE
jgi:hypothetical protein